MVQILASDTFSLSAVSSGGGVSLAAPLQIFTPAQVRLTTLANWPVGKTPKQMSTQGANAYGYIRRSWKPNNNDGTWIDIMPGWKPTSAAETMTITLNDNSTLNLGYTVAATIPTPSGSGVTRYLDASAAAGGTGTSGAPWNSWATAIAGLTAGDVLVVRAKTGTRTDNNGRQIPNYVYPADFGGSGTVTSTVSNVTIYADPTDAAAGRRPRIHINGSDLASFYDNPNGMWELDPSDPGGNCWRTTRATYTQTDSMNIWWRGPTGRVCGGYSYFNKSESSYLNQLRDTVYPRASYSGRNQAYVGPGVTFSAGRYYVRLSPPPLSTVVRGGFTSTPWYWGDYYPPGTNPNTVPLYVTTANDGAYGAGNACLTISNTTGWKIYNLDFACGHYGIRAGSTNGLQVWGCRFIGCSQGDHVNTDNGNSSQGKHIYALDSPNFLADHCEFYGGCPPWFTWVEGKGWNGAHALALRNGAYDFRSCTGNLSRHCHYEGFFSTLIFLAQTDLRFHHCTFLNCGQSDGNFITQVPSGTFEMIRSRLLTSTQTGWSGGPATTQQFHWVSNFISRYLPGSAAYKAIFTETSLDCDFMPVAIDEPHQSVGAGGEGKYSYFQNTVFGSQRGWNTAYGLGPAASLHPHRPNQFIDHSNYWDAINNLSVVKPSRNGYIWSSNYGPANPVDSYASHLIRGQPLVTADYNHYYRDPAMPNTGKTGIAWVWTYPSSGNGVACTTIAAIQSASSNALEMHGTAGDPGWSITYPLSSSDANLHATSNYLIQVGNAAATGGNTALSGKGAHDYDINTQITYPGYSWRGCFVPGVPAIEQDVGILGPPISTLP